MLPHVCYHMYATTCMLAHSQGTFCRVADFRIDTTAPAACLSGVPLKKTKLRYISYGTMQRSSEYQSSGYQSFWLLVPSGLAGLSPFGPSGTLRTGGTKSFWPSGTLRTGGTQSFRPPGTLWTAGFSPFRPQVPCGLAGLSPFGHQVPWGPAGLRTFAPPRYRKDWWNSVLSATR